MKFEITPVAFVESCYKEKFATPRQSGLVSEAKGKLRFVAPFNHPDAFIGLENCSHIWIEFVFHQCLKQGWKNKVRPPRLGGNEKMGVFATRATHRPNGMGLSVVKLDEISIEQVDSKDSIVLHVSGLDLIEGTPIIDVKPYVPYSDNISNAHYPFAQYAPKRLNVKFSAKAQQQIIDSKENSDFIESVLSLDPKPAFHGIDSSRTYGAKLNNYNVTWRYLIENDLTVIEVISVEPLAA